jgi:hypothetical protein
LYETIIWYHIPHKFCVNYLSDTNFVSDKFVFFLIIQENLTQKKQKIDFVLDKNVVFSQIILVLSFLEVATQIFTVYHKFEALYGGL